MHRRTLNLASGYEPELQDVPHNQQKFIAIPQDCDGNYMNLAMRSTCYSSTTQ